MFHVKHLRGSKTMYNLQPPCKGCTKRYLNCHSNCKEYKIFRITNECDKRKKREIYKNDYYIQMVEKMTIIAKDKHKRRKWGERI